MAASIPHNTGIAALINASNNSTPANNEATTSIFGEDGFTFGDIIDIVNPLQHIPIISNIYRKISGDTIAPAMEIAGGALFGGPIGAFTSMISVAFNSRDKIDSADPNSPYVDKESTTINPTTIAQNSSQQLQKAISIDDYSATQSTPINQANDTSPLLNNNSNWILSSSNIQKQVALDKATNNHVSANALQNRHTFQSADGIVNPAHKNTDIYKNAVTSKEAPDKTIDILIGAASDAG